jgi:formylglycine-generating enzyme required for sulfatase activity
MTTFISYSRVNSDFAVRLAKDLKKGDYDVWLDQLDIPTGSRWDDEIEKALEECEIFLIILSPESIKSQNVKDEIGYAIDTGKHILPVVLENCKVPFRLRRFQYVDCTDQPYNDSLDKIKFLLDNKKTVEPGDQGRKVPATPIQEKPKPEQKTKKQIWNSRTIGVFIGLAVLVLAAVFGLPLLLSQPESTPEPTMTANEPEPTFTPAPTFTAESASTTTGTPIPADITDSNGVEMALVPKGEFTMGSDTGVTDEQPSHNVYLDAFYIDKYEVTNADYKSCVESNECGIPVAEGTDYYADQTYADFPVIWVDWYMANTYCEWRGARLPTEAEWEKAARGTDERTYPWGEQLNPSLANYCDNDNAGCEIVVVGRYERGKSQYGVYDMAGNVWEWVADWYWDGYYASLGADVENPQGPSSGTFRVIRGGSWLNGQQDVRSIRRYIHNPDDGTNLIGFRCAKSVTP